MNVVVFFGRSSLYFVLPLGTLGWLLDTLTLEPAAEVDVEFEVEPIQKATVVVEVVKSSGQVYIYTVHVPKGASLLNALELIQRKNAGFT